LRSAPECRSSDHMLTLFAKHAVVGSQTAPLPRDLKWTASTPWKTRIALGLGLFAGLCEKEKKTTGNPTLRQRVDPRNPLTGEATCRWSDCLARLLRRFSGRPYMVWRGLDTFASRAEQKRKDLGHVDRVPLGWPGIFPRLRQRGLASCIWNCSMGRNRTTLRMIVQRLLQAVISPVSATPGLRENCPVKGLLLGFE